MSFIKAIAVLLQDRNTLEIKSKKIKEDLLLTIFPTKGKIHNITIPEADLQDPDLDAKIIGLINAPVENASFQHTATEAPEKDEEEEEEEDTKKEPAKPAGKKAPAKKAVPAKKAAKKAAPSKKVEKEEVVGDEQHQKELAEALQPDPADQVDPEDEKDLADAVKAEEQASAPAEEEKSAPAAEEEKVTAPEPEQVAAPAAEEEEEVAGPSNQELFDLFMDEGKKLFAARKYKDAQTTFQKAANIFPDNQECVKELKKAKQWVTAIERAGI